MHRRVRHQPGRCCAAALHLVGAFVLAFGWISSSRGLKGMGARQAGYTSGCAEMAQNPARLMLYMIPGCHVGVLEPFVRSIMHRKAYELGALLARHSDGCIACSTQGGGRVPRGPCARLMPRGAGGVCSCCRCCCCTRHTERGSLAQLRDADAAAAECSAVAQLARRPLRRTRLHVGAFQEGHVQGPVRGHIPHAHQRAHRHAPSAQPPFHGQVCLCALLPRVS